jgi:Glu-tRNA(Gln) amidotransferase subunit E-like FAD-binding protein
MDAAEVREIVEESGLTELQREQVQELIAEANRKLLEQLRRPLIPT